MLQLRHPGTGASIFLGTNDALLCEDWLEDLLYVQQRQASIPPRRSFVREAGFAIRVHLFLHSGKGDLGRGGGEETKGTAWCLAVCAWGRRSTAER